MRTGLTHAAQQAGASDHHHARPHTVCCAAVDLDGPAEPVWTESDHLRSHHPMAGRLLEFERGLQVCVLLGSGVQLHNLAAQCLVRVAEPDILSAQR